MDYRHIGNATGAPSYTKESKEVWRFGKRRCKYCGTLCVFASISRPYDLSQEEDVMLVVALSTVRILRLVDNFASL
jgi:hypothetical protein